jgi:hypothetical protein
MGNLIGITSNRSTMARNAIGSVGSRNPTWNLCSSIPTKLLLGIVIILGLWTLLGSFFREKPCYEFDDDSWFASRGSRSLCASAEDHHGSH